jgi:hypothetical protein
MPMTAEPRPLLDWVWLVRTENDIGFARETSRMMLQIMDEGAANGVDRPDIHQQIYALVRAMQILWRPNPQIAMAFRKDILRCFDPP